MFGRENAALVIMHYPAEGVHFHGTGACGMQRCPPSFQDGQHFVPTVGGQHRISKKPLGNSVLFKVQGMFKSNHNTKVMTGTSWWSCGKASALSLQGTRVPSLGRELRFCVPWAKRQINK